MEDQQDGASVVAAKVAGYRATSDGAITAAESIEQHEAADAEEEADRAVADLLEQVAQDPEAARVAARTLVDRIASETPPGGEALRSAATLMMRFADLVEADRG